MKIVACEIGMFSLGQKIYIIDTETNLIEDKIEIDNIMNIEQTIVDACHSLDTVHVHLYGNQEYLINIIYNINTYNKIKYNNDKELIIEVN